MHINKVDKLFVIKLGGNVIDEETQLTNLLETFAAIKEKKILVHGGGKMATRLAEKLGVKQQLVDGRRITDRETLEVVTMVYAGYINKNIVARLASLGCNAIGLSGPDGNIISAHKRETAGMDYGFAGDIDHVNTGLIKNLIEQGLTPVISPITHDQKAQLLNTNADTVASEIAAALASVYETHLIYLFEKTGVLRADQSVISQIDRNTYATLKQDKVITAGMIPKLDNAFAALDRGVKNVMLGSSSDLRELISGSAGTTISHA